MFLPLQANGVWTTCSSSVTTREIIEHNIDIYVNSWVIDTTFVSSESQVIRGPSPGQIFHMDSLLPTLNCLVYMVDDSPATEVIDLNFYGISFKGIRDSFNKDFNYKWLQGPDGEYSPDFTLCFLEKFFPLKRGPICKDPKVLKMPLIKKGSALFFDGRVLHRGPPCAEERWLIYRNWIPKNLFSYHESYNLKDKNTPQYRAHELLKIIHYLEDETLSQKEYDDMVVTLQ